MTDYLATDQILGRLEQERTSLVTLLARIPQELQNQRPAPDRWSIAEILEHLVSLEIGVTKLLGIKGQAAPAAEVPPPPPEASGTPRLGALVRDRSRKIEAPERVRPAGTLSADEAFSRLQAVRAGMLAAFATANAEALDKQTHVHPFFGQLTLRSWVALAADHEARHVAQIAEVAEQLGP